jgi:hypothetical protein
MLRTPERQLVDEVIVAADDRDYASQDIERGRAVVEQLLANFTTNGNGIRFRDHAAPFLDATADLIGLLLARLDRPGDPAP